MNDITSSSARMTSLEIAELVDSRHDKVKQSIERLAERGVIELPPTGEIPTATKPTTIYIFDHAHKRDSFVVVAQLSPEFTGRLVDRWQALETGQATPAFRLTPQLAQIHQPRPQAVRELLLIAKQMGKEVPGIDKALAHAVALDAIETATGLPARLMARALPAVAIEEAATMNATQLGEALGGFTSRAVGIMIANAGWKEKNAAGDWVLTEAGKPYGEMKPYHRNGHSGYDLRWKPAAVQALRAIQAKDAAA